MDKQQIIKIDQADLLGRVVHYMHRGYRLNQMCATKTPEGFELSYTFSIFEDFQTLRMQVADDVMMPSISSIYPASFLYENEMSDLFGLRIVHMAVDYGGNLYRTSVKTPFNPKTPEGGGQ